MVAFNSSFRVFLVSAIVLGMSANAAPSPASDNPFAWGRRGDPGSPGSHNSGDSSKSSVSAYSVFTNSGEECWANSASRARYTDQAFLQLAPELAPDLAPKKSRNRRGLTNTPRGPSSDDEEFKKNLGFDTDERPDPTKPKGITLYHGTLPKFSGSLHRGVKIFNNRGDLSANGGFYLTNSMRAAAQWGCRGRGENIPQTVVFEYIWTPADATIRSHEDWKTAQEYADFCTYNTCPQAADLSTDVEDIKAIVKKEYDMIAGPMMPVGGDITAGFYQYAILNKEKVEEPYLKQVRYHLLACSLFPKGNINTRDTQGPSKDFDEELELNTLGLGKGSELGQTFDASQPPPAEWATGGPITLADRLKPQN